MDQFQDALAIGIATLTASWLAWTLFKRIHKPSCGPRTDVPDGADGFVSIDTLAPKKSGRPEGRPDR